MQDSIRPEVCARNDSNTYDTVSWSMMNSTTREHLLIYFTTDLRKTLGLTRSEYDQLSQTVNAAISRKLILPENIVIRNSNRIQTIMGLLWNPSNRKFYMDPTIKEKTTRTAVREKDIYEPDKRDKDKIAGFSKHWHNLLETVSKSRAKEHSTYGIVDNSNVSVEFIIVDD